MITKPFIQSIPSFSSALLKVDTLRLDTIHPVVSGNKWYKLNYYIKDALQHNKTFIASFGGPYSNHLVALAFAAKYHGLTSIGYIRANNGEPITPMMQEAMNYGMQLQFLGRTNFQEQKNIILQNRSSPNYFIYEGGYGKLGAKGAATIMKELNSLIEITQIKYDAIICAVGTGTMISGIINASEDGQQIIGIPVLKNEDSIPTEIKNLLNTPFKPFTILPNFHGGGYAKTTKAQLNFMNQFWEEEKIPTDIVYTGKLFWAVKQLLNANYFSQGKRLLIIHSGGLQGNRSLAKGVLDF